MLDLGENLRKLILAGVGVAAVTKEKGADVLNELVKKGELTIEQGKVLNEELKRENDQVAETEQSADNLAAVLADLTEELKVTKRQRIREIMKKPEQEASIEALYDEMEADLQKKIDGINHQINLLSDKRNTIIQVNRVAKTAIDVFRDILEKDKLERNDLELLIDKILVFEDHLEIKLQSDIIIIFIHKSAVFVIRSACLCLFA